MVRSIDGSLPWACCEVLVELPARVDVVLRLAHGDVMCDLHETLRSRYWFYRVPRGAGGTLTFSSVVSFSRISTVDEKLVRPGALTPSA